MYILDDEIDLAEALYFAKKEEANAKERRIQLEIELSKKYKLKPEGLTTVKNGLYKIAFLAGFNRLITNKGLEMLKADSRVDDCIIDTVFRTTVKHEINLTEYRLLSKTDNELFQFINEVITTKPKKIHIKIEPINPVGIDEGV